MNVKILSYIMNLRKIIFACPVCMDHQSALFDSNEQESLFHKCTTCKNTYDVDLTQLKQQRDDLKKD